VERTEWRRPISNRAARLLQRRLNAVTPWHVRVRISAKDDGEASVAVRSLRWPRSDTLRSSYSDDSAGIERFLSDALETVQSFLVNQSRTAWPRDHSLPVLSEATASAWVDELPRTRVALSKDTADLGWQYEGRPVLSLGKIELT